MHEVVEEVVEHEQMMTLMAGEPSEGVSDKVPKTIAEAYASPEAESWKAAVEKEMGNMKRMGTWKLEEMPKDRKAVGCRWVFAKKYDENGNVKEYKARLVAQGFAQKPGTDFSYNGTFAPVMRFET